MLPWTIYISFIGVFVLMLLPREQLQLARRVALAAAVLGLAAGVGASRNIPAGLKHSSAGRGFPGLASKFSWGQTASAWCSCC